MSALLLSLLTSPAAVSIFSGIARHALVGLGAVLISKNWITPSDMNALTGAVMTIIGVVWSVGAKAIPDSSFQADVGQPK